MWASNSDRLVLVDREVAQILGSYGVRGPHEEAGKALHGADILVLILSPRCAHVTDVTKSH
jgi:hypothetical protein